jgi:hypothetical protein
MTFSYSKTIESTSTFEQTTGIKVGVDVSVSVKVPFVESTDVTVSTEVSHDWTYGGDNSVSYTFEADSPLTVPAGKTYQAEALCKQSQMTIPYTGVVYYVDTSVTKSVTGTYTGVDLYQLETTISVIA